jgi:hypothetical protein
MIDLKKVGEFFTQKKLWDKPFNQWSREDMEALAEVFFSSPGPEVPADGWSEPHIDKNGRLLIPCRVHPKFRWWMPDGMSIIETINFICDRDGYCKFCRDELIRECRPTGWDPKME